MTERSMKFSSSRTFPGHGQLTGARIVSGQVDRTRHQFLPRSRFSQDQSLGISRRNYFNEALNPPQGCAVAHHPAVATSTGTRLPSERFSSFSKVCRSRSAGFRPMIFPRGRPGSFPAPVLASG
jgi:hypothetical protein